MRTMNRLLALAMLLCLLTPAVAKDKKLVLNGWVTDLKCARTSAASAIAPEHADCARKCSADSGAMALVTDPDHRVLAIENGFMVRGLEGELVSINGIQGATPESLKITAVMLKQK